MPINTQSNTTPDALANAPGAPAKGRKSKGARKTMGVSSARSAAPRSATPAEILFQDQPNPYHPPVPPYIWIDHPQQSERLLGPIYVIRLGAGGTEQVELSIDSGPWLACRLTSGYWWYDWSGIQPGKHTLVARMRTSDNRWFRTPTRNCDYRP